MALIIDGVFLQLQRPALTRLWQNLLPLLARKLEMPVVLLDRGGRCKQIDGVEVVPFPTYKSKFNAGDSALLEKVCRHYGAQVFLSTHFTTPLQTPSVLVVCDMISERLDVYLGTRDQQEKEIAIAHARRFLCLSEATRDGLLAFFPELDRTSIRVAHWGVDPVVFKPATNADISAFRSSHGIGRPYLLSFEATTFNAADKNNALLPDALSTIAEADFDVLCIGASGDPSTSTLLANGCRVIRTPLDDRGLALAYTGAAALVCPSLHDGYGLTVAEAMACGCPIIATSTGALTDVAQDTAMAINATSSSELAEAIRAVLEPAVRAARSDAVVHQSIRFRWDSVADALVGAIQETANEQRAGLHWNFYETWARLRSIQGEVDIMF